MPWRTQGTSGSPPASRGRDGRWCGLRLPPRLPRGSRAHRDWRRAHCCGPVGRSCRWDGWGGGRGHRTSSRPKTPAGRRPRPGCRSRAHRTPLTVGTSRTRIRTGLFPVRPRPAAWDCMLAASGLGPRPSAGRFGDSTNSSASSGSVHRPIGLVGGRGRPEPDVAAWSPPSAPVELRFAAPGWDQPWPSASGGSSGASSRSRPARPPPGTPPRPGRER